MVNFAGSIKVVSFPTQNKAVNKAVQDIQSALGRIPNLTNKVKSSDADVKFMINNGITKAEAYFNKSQIGLGGDLFRKHQFETNTMFVKRILTEVLNFVNKKKITN